MAPDHAASSDWSNLGKWLQHSRRGVAQGKIYAACGVSQNTIKKWEHGENTQTSEALYDLIEFYGWPASALDRALAGEPIPEDLPQCPKTPRAQVPMPPLPLDDIEDAARLAEELGLTEAQRAKLAASFADRSKRSV